SAYPYHFLPFASPPGGSSYSVSFLRMFTGGAAALSFKITERLRNDHKPCPPKRPKFRKFFCFHTNQSRQPGKFTPGIRKSYQTVITPLPAFLQTQTSSDGDSRGASIEGKFRGCDLAHTCRNSWVSGLKTQH